MPAYIIPVIIVAVILSICLLLLIFAFICEFIVFGKRCDKNPLLKYFTAEDFGLSAEPVSLPKGLNGFLYKKNEPARELIVFCHGMGAGHLAYTTEIAYFCNLGYAVLAVDYRGCNLSEGKNLKGMYSGVKTAIAAIDYARSVIKPDKLFLVGHSWGAYSALCASAKRKVDKVVAISAPDTPSKIMQEGAGSAISRPFAAILRPFFYLVEFFNFGAKGNLSASKCAKKNGAPTLLIHGDKDKVVSVKKSAYGNAEGENITKLLARGKAHNPYNTVNAEKQLSELSAKLRAGERDFTGFDFSAATEEDKEVMRAISEFIANN